VTTPTKLFDEAAIARRVGELASAIAAAAPADVTLVSVLKGSFVFAADLIRALHRLDLTPRIEFIHLSSYGHGTRSSGEVRLIGDVPANLAGRSIVLVEDILDTGRSLAFAKELLTDEGAVRVWTCVLVDKPSRREIEISADFTGFTVDDLFVVGYGVDYAEDYRHLPYIGTID
jgi:hypoxanthine phosphoribosyltransferase